jgi:4-amino-4-deoxy-L-arabinose transferase-like glycosyltransferase
MASVRHGLIAAAVCASSLLLLRYGRSATTDIHLALWVALTNLCLIKAYFRGRPILWLPLAGVAAGLAFMSKGPVGLAQSVLPIAIFVIVRALFCRSAIDAPSPELSTDPSKSRATKWIAAALLGVAAMLAVALPWFVYVFRTVPDVWTMWKTEITRDGATTMRADPIHTYLVILPMLLPWTIFLIAGMVECARDWKRDPAKHLSILVLVIPIIVMSLVKDKNERYLLPLAPAGALVAAFALLPQLRPGREQSRVDRSLRQLHMIVLFVIAVGVPAAGAIATLQRGGEAWWSWQFAAVAVGLMVLIPIALNFIHVKRPASLVVLTALLMLCANALFLYGYKTSMNGRSEMRAVADDILAHHPQAEVYYVDTRESPKAIPQDLQIYLNRRVRTVYGLSPLPAPQPGRVLVVLQREHEPDPNIAGWKHFARQPWGERGWHALTAE